MHNKIEANDNIFMSVSILFLCLQLWYSLSFYIFFFSYTFLNTIDFSFVCPTTFISSIPFYLALPGRIMCLNTAHFLTSQLLTELNINFHLNKITLIKFWNVQVESKFFQQIFHNLISMMSLSCDKQQAVWNPAVTLTPSHFLPLSAFLE